MHFVIMGCGRAGAMLAELLENRGHSVAIIDQAPEAFRRLYPDFEGRRVTGVGFDRDVLIQAGIEDAYAFAAVSSGDNSNILAARVVRETFGINRVVARIYDANRAEIYQRLGIPTVATVPWTAEQVMRRLLPVGGSDEFVDASGTIKMALMSFHPSWIGQRYSHLAEATGARIGFISRFGDGLLPDPDTVVQASDEVHVLVRTDDFERVQRALLQQGDPQ